MVTIVMHMVMVAVMTLHDHSFRVGEASEAENGEAKNEQSFHR